MYERLRQQDHFVMRGDPNSPGIPPWPSVTESDSIRFLRLDIETAVEPERHRERYLLLEEILGGTLVD